MVRGLNNAAFISSTKTITVCFFSADTDVSVLGYRKNLYMHQLSGKMKACFYNHWPTWVRQESRFPDEKMRGR